MTDQDGHEAIRDGDRYEVYVDNDGYLIWSEVDNDGVPHPFIGVCNLNDEECGLADEGMEIPEGEAKVDIPRNDKDGDWREPIEAPSDLLREAIIKHEETKTKAMVKNAL